MKNNLKLLYQNYLNNIGQLPDTSLGSDDQKIPLNITKGQNDFFITQLHQQANIHDKFILTILILFVLLPLLMGIFLILFYQKQPLISLLVFVSIIAFMLFMLYQLKKFWLEKNLITISIGLMSDLSPKEAAAYIQRIYLQILQPGAHQAIDDFTHEVLENSSIKKRKQFSDKTNNVRKLIDKNECRAALEQLKEIIDQHKFLKKAKSTILNLSVQERELREKEIIGTPKKEDSRDLIDRILKFCDDIDNDMEEFYQ